jgi:hypothetical protein
MENFYRLVHLLSQQAADHRAAAGVDVKNSEHAHAGQLCLRLATELPAVHDTELAQRFGTAEFDADAVAEYVSLIGREKFPLNARQLLEALTK